MAKKKITEAEEESSKGKALELALSTIKKNYGVGSIITKDIKLEPIERISTGSPSLDLAINGGIPKGRIIEIFGVESSGKSTLCLSIVTQCQKANGKCAYIDAEHALDIEYAAQLGVNVDDLLISQPDCGEDALNIVDLLARSGEVDLIIIDSVAALVPRSELEGDVGASSMGVHARLMSQSLRKIVGIAEKTKTTIIYINQVRSKIGIVYGNPEVTSGGNALKFYSSQRFELRRKEYIKEGEEIIGITTNVTVVKNKTGSPFKKVPVDIIFGKGVDIVGDYLELGIQYGVIEKGGAWYSVGETKIGQGKDNAKQYLSEHPELIDMIKEAIEK